MFNLVLDVFFERSVVVIDVEVISFVEVVRDVDIDPVVVIKITERNAEAETDNAAVNACLHAYIFKHRSIIAKELVAPQRIPHGPKILVRELANRNKAVVEQIHVEI